MEPRLLPDVLPSAPSAGVPSAAGVEAAQIVAQAQRNAIAGLNGPQATPGPASILGHPDASGGVEFKIATGDPQQTADLSLRTVMGVDTAPPRGRVAITALTFARVQIVFQATDQRQYGRFVADLRGCLAMPDVAAAEAAYREATARCANLEREFAAANSAGMAAAYELHQLEADLTTARAMADLEAVEQHEHRRAVLTAKLDHAKGRDARAVELLRVAHQLEDAAALKLKLARAKAAAVEDERRRLRDAAIAGLQEAATAHLATLLALE